MSILATAAGYLAGAGGLLVIDDDSGLPTVGWESAAQTLSEEDAAGAVRVVLSAAATDVVTVPFTVAGTATPGVDHDLADGTIVIAAGATTGARGFTLTYDGVAEGDETIVVTLGVPTNAVATGVPTHSITITDSPSGSDDGRPGGDGDASDSGPSGTHVVQAVGCGCAAGDNGRFWAMMALLAFGAARLARKRTAQLAASSSSLLCKRSDRRFVAAPPQA